MFFSSTKDLEKKIVNLFYFCVYFFISLVFLAILYRPITRSLFSQDLWWFNPSIAQFTEGLSFGKLLFFLFDVRPLWYGYALLKVYDFLMLTLFGPQVKYFVFFSLIIHATSSYLLFCVSRKIGQGFRVSVLSALMYLTAFSHFHAYIWPMAFQHLVVIFSTLLVFNFYLKTDQLIDRGASFRAYWWLTLGTGFLLSFCRANILLLPIVILVHILFCSRDDKDRFKKYSIWLPLFVIYLGYPLVTLTYTGDPKLSMFFEKIDISAKYSVLFISGIFLLFLFRGILQFWQNYKISRVSKRVLIAIALISVFLLVSGVRDIGLLTSMKNLLLPYNLMVPFVGFLMSFLHPIQNALLINSSSVYHFIPPQVDVFSFILSLLLVAIFIKICVDKNRGLVIFLAWYLVSFLYLNLRTPIASRHFIYISPVVCIIFCSVLIYIYDFFVEKTRIKAIHKEFLLLLIFVALFIPNMLAIRFEIFRGRIANNFLIYDYVRMVNIIKEDLTKSTDIKTLNPERLYINNVKPMPYELWYKDVWSDVDHPPDPLKYDNFRYVLAQIFGSNSMLGTNINQIPVKGEDYMLYFADKERINNTKGQNIEPFFYFFQEAVKNMELKHYKVADDLFKRAVRQRPFLLNYILSKYRLEDLKWITNDRQMRSWVNKIALGYHRGGETPRKITYISTIMNKELDSYIECLFYLSYLRYLSSETKASKYWLYQIGFIERDYEKIYHHLSQVHTIKSDKEILSFLKSFDSSSLYKARDCLTYYELERFLFKMMLN